MVPQRLSLASLSRAWFFKDDPLFYLLNESSWLAVIMSGKLTKVELKRLEDLKLKIDLQQKKLNNQVSHSI